MLKVTDYKAMAAQTIKDIADRKEAKRIRAKNDLDAHFRMVAARMKHMRG